MKRAAIVLAAGLGSRLKPYTDHQPKWCVQVGKHTLLEHYLNSFRSNNITDVYVVTGHKSDELKSAFRGFNGDSFFNPTFIYNDIYLVQ